MWNRKATLPASTDLHPWQASASSGAQRTGGKQRPYRRKQGRFPPQPTFLLHKSRWNISHEQPHLPEGWHFLFPLGVLQYQNCPGRQEVKGRSVWMSGLTLDVGCPIWNPLRSPTWLKVKVAQSCLILCNPMDCIVHRILEARILGWGAISFSRGSSQPRNRPGVSCIAGGFFTNWA